MRYYLKDKISTIGVKLTDPAQEFVQNRVTLNDVQSKTSETGQHLSEPQDETTPQQQEGSGSTSQVERTSSCAHFAEALRSFEESLPDELKTRFALQDKHTWSEVISEAKLAEMKYNKKSHRIPTFWGTNGIFRKLLSHSSAMENWLALLPSESEYGSLICGVFKIILRAATRMSEIKDFIVKTMADIPEKIDKAQLFMDYNEDQDPARRLYDSITALYGIVFDILNDIIRWYRERAIKHVTKVLFGQGDYEKELESKGESFKEAIEKVKEEGKNSAPWAHVTPLRLGFVFPRRAWFKLNIIIQTTLTQYIATICGFRRLQSMDKNIQDIALIMKKLEESERYEKERREILEKQNSLEKLLVIMCRSSPTFNYENYHGQWR